MPRQRTTSRNGSQPLAAMSVCGWSLIWTVRLVLLRCFLYAACSPPLLPPGQRRKCGSLPFHKPGRRLGLLRYRYKSLIIGSWMELKMCTCKEIDVIVANQRSYGNADNLPFFSPHKTHLYAKKGIRILSTFPQQIFAFGSCRYLHGSIWGLIEFTMVKS